MQNQHSLNSNTILNNYRIIKVLGFGGFGITYLAVETNLNSEVVIKEYFPNEFAIRNNDSSIIAKPTSNYDFSRGKQRFQEEAQVLAKFNHPSIVRILGYFEANNTAYFVMEYEEGLDLSEYLKQLNRSMTQEEILSIIIPILEGLKEVHRYNYLHRDIKPGNILLRNNHSPVLIDFGASRLAVGESSKSITSMLTEGYAPLEQYSTDVKQQGPFTDIYAVAAVIYKMITGNVPPSAQTRSYQLLQDGHDPVQPLSSLKLSGYDNNFLNAIDKALSIKAKDRPQDVQEFQADIAGELKINQSISVNPAKKEKPNMVIIVVFLLILIVISFIYFVQGNRNYFTQEELVVTQQTEQKINSTSISHGEEKKDELEKIKEEFEQVKKEKEDIKKQQLEVIEQAKKEVEEKHFKKENVDYGTSLFKAGKAFYNGTPTIPQDYTRAKEYFLEAAQNHNVDAYRYLGTMYLWGHGTLVNIDQAKKWLRMAIDEGDERAKEIYNMHIVETKKQIDYKTLETYYNSRFGFSLRYPVNLLTKITYPQNGDGIWMTNDDATVEVTPSASFAWNTSSAKEMYKESIAWRKENNAVEITYKRQKNNWYVLSGYNHKENKIFYEKYYLINGVRSGFSILFPKNDQKIYEELVNIIAKSFKPSSGEK